jgi:hypothetical protein
MIPLLTYRLIYLNLFKIELQKLAFIAFENEDFIESKRNC